MATKKKSRTVRSSKPRKSAPSAKRRTSKKKNWMSLDVASYWKSFLGIFGVTVGLAFFLYKVGPTGPAGIEIVHESETIKPTSSDPFEQAEAMPIGERVEFWSHHLANLVKKGKSLEKFAGLPTIQDSAPLMPAKYNCTTFVETIGALARSQRGKDFYRNILSIRYKNSEGTFSTRNHFPEADWIPNNVRAGNLKDVTKEVASSAGVTAATQSKSIHKAQWLSKQMKAGSVDRALASAVDSDWNRPVSVSLSYIPKDQVEKVLNHLADGTVVNLVRANNAKFDVMISHQGVIVKNGTSVLFRHASTDGSVRTQPFAEYIQGQNYKGWPIVGINLNQWTEGWN